MRLENLHHFVQSMKPREVPMDKASTDVEACGPDAVRNLIDTLGERAKVQCLTPEQVERVADRLSDYIGKAPNSNDFEMAVKLLVLSFKADCSRCTAGRCHFRRARNSRIQGTTKRKYYSPIVQD